MHDFEPYPDISAADLARLFREHPRRFAVLWGLVKGTLTDCHACHEAVPRASVVVIGTLEDGSERHICQTCASLEKHYARTPDEECEQCGVIRKKAGSAFCSEACERKMRALGLDTEKEAS